MKKFCAFIFLGLVTGCLPTQTPNQIIVDGEASLEIAPDTFHLEGSLRSRGQSQAAVLAEIAEGLARIRETMPRLEGLSHLAIDASAAEIMPVQNSECLDKRPYDSRQACSVEGYFGVIKLSITGSPAKSSGHALSLLSELGAERVILTHYLLTDVEAAQQEALDAAVRSARRNAQSIAGAAGAMVLGPVRVQYGAGFPDRESRPMVTVRDPGRLGVEGERTVTPETELDLDPQPITIEAKVVAAFEIE